MGGPTLKYLLDTHTWIWWNMNPDKLSRKVYELLEGIRGNESLFLSAISIWEFCKLIELNRLSISCDGESWINEALDDPLLNLVPLTPKIAWQSTKLPQPFHRDPGDQIIVATAREIKATVLTKDSLVQQYAHVHSLW